MSFRQYGGVNYAARNNIVRNNYSNANNLSVMTKVGQPASYINFESDISGNTIYGDLTVNGNLTITGDGNGIIFPDTTIQYTAVTSTDTYWLKYSTGKIYYTGTVLVGVNPDTTFPDIPNDISFATNGNVFVGGKFNVGYISGGDAVSLFSVDGLTGNTIVGGINTKYLKINPPATVGYVVGSDTYGGVILAGNSVTSGLWIQSAGGCRITDISGAGTSKSDLTITNGNLTVSNGNLTVSNGNMYIASTVTTTLSSPAFKIQLNNNSNCIIYQDTTSGDAIIQNNGGGALRLLSDNGSGVYISGNNSYVGINKINPLYELDVGGTCNSTSFNASSDYRIKENVLSLNDSLFTVDNLRPVTYTNILLGKQDMGFIAHELQEHYPFLVTGEKDGPNNQSVNYIGLIALLVKEIQELKQDIKILKMK